MRFEPTPCARVEAGLTLQIPSEGAEPRYLCITHEFEDCVYVMWVSDSTGARYARRPKKMPTSDLDAIRLQEGVILGRRLLPQWFLDADMNRKPGVPTEADAAWELIEPLITEFSYQRNLDRSMFTMLIREHGKKKQVPYISLVRLVLRYYYFGRNQAALANLPRGPEPNAAAPSSDGKPRPAAKRRGRNSVVEEKYGENTFVTSEDDIAEMVARLRTMSRAKATTVKAAWKEYLRIDFAKRHKAVYKLYAEKKHPEPVTLRQFRGYTNEFLELDAVIAENLRTAQARRVNRGGLDAIGPGEVYEIDATGGRVYLVTSGPKKIPVGKPTIYIIIDRWSRYIVSIYVSLRAPSWEEARYALLVAFTSRELRFQPLGIDIDDERWPIGRMCTSLRQDRGSDFMSGSMQSVVSKGLRSEASVLPAYTPNGKAIVERVIRSFKGWMAEGVKGAYAKRPMTPQTKKAAAKAKEVAVYSLTELYRKLIEFVVRYNTKPHTALKKYDALIQAGVSPTPQAAYLWGLKNLTGLRVSPYSDDQFQRMLMGEDFATMQAGVLTYKKYRYEPGNENANEMSRASSDKRQSIKVRVDKTYPFEVFIPRRNEWAKFRMIATDRRSYGTMTQDEREAFAPVGSRLSIHADHDSVHAEVTGPRSRSPKANQVEPEVDRLTTNATRRGETNAVRGQMVGRKQAAAAKPPPAAPPASWKDRQRQRREQQLAEIASLKNKDTRK